MPADQHSDSLRIELLGGFRIACGANEIPDDGWRLAKARSLVKIVALAPGQSILREQLVDMLWPELDPDAGANNLHQALHVARRTLGALLPDAKTNRILRLQRGVLSLEPPTSLWIDVDAFEEQARDLQSSDDPADFYHALDIYRGDLLPDDLYEDWAAERRIALHEQYLSLLDRLAAMHRARREATPAIDALRRIVAIEPDREAAHRDLMELYALTGRRQQALRQYERAREILERELDLEPEPETDDLHDAILSGDYPAETWATEPSTEPQATPRPEITESISEFLSRAGDFVGRGNELGTLQGALSRVIGGKGEIILVAGEPGIGKTRMSEEFLRYAGSQGVRTLWGRCYEGDGAPAYWPWVQVVRSYVEGRSTAELRTVMGPGAADIARIAPELRERLPDLEEPPPLDPDGERFRLFDSMTTFLKNAAERAPLALIIDDLHSADRSSLLLLEFLAREIVETGLLIIGTYRHVEVERGHPLTRTLGQLARHESNERITLDGLRVADIDRYIELVTGRETPEGLAAAIHEQTEGNPFFVREIVALLIEEERLNNPEDVRSWRLTIPHGIRETIALRTARLSDTAHRVLTTASVSGRDFELPIVAQVADLDELDTLDALEEALGTGLILESPPTPGGFRFTHAITRQTLYDDLSQARRLRMHLRTGEAIEGMAGEDSIDRLSEIAQHFYISASLGIEDKAIRWLTRTGEYAVRLTAYDEAVQYLNQAVEVQIAKSGATSSEVGRLLIHMGEYQRFAGEPQLAIETLERSVDIARDCEDFDALARAAIVLSEAAYQQGDGRAAYVPLLQEASEVLGDQHPDLRVRLLSRIAQDLIHTFAAIPDAEGQAQCASYQALEAADHLADTELRLVARLGLQAVLEAKDSDREKRNNLRDIGELITDETDKRYQVIFRSYRIGESLSAGELESLITEVDAYESLALELRQPANLWAASFRRTMLALLIGDFDEAERLAEATFALGRRSAPTQALEVYFKHLTLIRLEQDRAADVLDLASDITKDYPPYSEPHLLYCLILTAIGEDEEPCHVLETLARSRFAEIPRNVIWPSNAAILAMIVAEVGHESAARELYTLLIPYEKRVLSGGGHTVGFGAASHYLGTLAGTFADHDRAAQHLKQAINQNLRLGARALTAHSQFALGALLQARKDVSTATCIDDLFSQALAAAQNLKMKRLELRIRDLARNTPGAGQHAR